jgi:hypothetical protein
MHCYTKLVETQFFTIDIWLSLQLINKGLTHPVLLLLHATS